MDAPADGALPTTGARPFDLPPRATLAASPRHVFAHYFVPFPLSVDNVDPASDYYARNWLTPAGEGGKHAAYGGFLRDRPSSRPPLPASPPWLVIDKVTEIREAIDAGLDGFTVDLLQIAPGSQRWTQTLELLDAADQVGDFSIILMPDMAVLSATSDPDGDALAAAIASVAGRPSLYHLPGGRLVVSPFASERRTAAWWTAWIAKMKSAHGITIAFFPTFLNWRPNAAAFAPFSVGLGNWGSRSPAANVGIAGDVAAAHAHTCVDGAPCLWFQPVSVQDERPNQRLYDEAANTENLLTTWRGAIDGGADFVQLVTWNDYSEGTELAPSRNNGWSYLDVSSYFLSRYKTGSYPEIVRDGLYLTHRVQLAAAQPSYPETMLMTLRAGSTPARDFVEVLSFLTAPAEVSITAGGHVTTFSAPSGVSEQTAALFVGAVSASASRGGVGFSAVTSPFQVVSQPFVQDLGYRGRSSLR